MKKEFYFKTENLVIWRPEGMLDASKISEFIEYLEEHNANRDQHFHRFIDLSKVAGINVTYTSLTTIASKRLLYAKDSLSRKVKMAFLAGNAFTFGMARMYESILGDEHYDIIIFETLQEVARWLEVDQSLLME